MAGLVFGRAGGAEGGGGVVGDEHFQEFGALGSLHSGD